MKEIFSIKIPGKLPSWNAVLAMDHWKRKQFKDQLQADFLSALRVSAKDFSTRTTSARNTMSIAVATLESYQKTMQEKRALKLANAKLKKAKKSTP